MSVENMSRHQQKAPKNHVIHAHRKKCYEEDIEHVFTALTLACGVTLYTFMFLQQHKGNISLKIHDNKLILKKTLVSVLSVLFVIFSSLHHGHDKKFKKLFLNE
jgi:hypothetical protein